MSENAAERDTLGIMVVKLIMVMLGFLLLVLVITGVGYLGNAYYTALMETQEFELVKQEAFTRGQSVEDYLRTELAAERMSQELYDKFMGTLERQRTSAEQEAQVIERVPETAQPPASLAVPPEKILPPPDVDVSPTELAAMKGKAVLIHTTVGTIVVELYPEIAPRTCKNFLYLVENGFYDGLFFHRNQPHLYIQAGSPTGWRNGSAGYWLNMEYSQVVPAIGAVAALARQDAPQISSEFIIFVGDGSKFPGDVTVFGRVIDHFDVAEKIADTRWDQRGYSFERTYIRTVEIVDADSVRPEEDFWANYGK